MAQARLARQPTDRRVYPDAAKAPDDARLTILRDAADRCVVLEAAHGIPFDFRVIVNETPDLSDLAPDVTVEFVPRGVPDAWWDLFETAGDPIVSE